MAITHATSGESINVRPLGERLATEKTTALFKSTELEVIRLVLLAGKSMPSHRVAGEVTIQCIEGRLDVTTEGASRLLDAGQLMFLLGNVPHAIVALENSSALVTIVLSR